MKRLEIIVEGQSEREFITQVLAPYLERQSVIKAYDVYPIVVRTSAASRHHAFAVIIKPATCRLNDD